MESEHLKSVPREDSQPDALTQQVRATMAAQAVSGNRTALTLVTVTMATIKCLRTPHVPAIAARIHSLKAITRTSASDARPDAAVIKYYFYTNIQP